jgi:hypothetical protein
MTLDPEALLRTMLIVLHLLAFALAAVGTAFCDYAVLVKRRLDVVLMHRASKVVTIALGALWLSGLTVAWVDTQLDLRQMLAMPKLMAKFTVVSVLTANGVLLHRFIFPLFLTANRGGGFSSRLPALLGGVSAASWVYAVFLGVAANLAAELGYTGFMLLYGVALLVAMGVSQTFVQPHLLTRLNPQATAAGATRSGPSACGYP